MEQRGEALDLIWGIDEIGKVIGRSFPQTMHMVRAGHLPPVKQIGQRYYASRRQLIDFLLNGAEAA